MPAHGHTTTWGTHIGVGRATDVKGWYALLKAWWGDHKAARDGARLATLKAHWDARRETVHSFRADAAIDIVQPAHLDTTARVLCELSL
jgi:hypothetical protein